ncbi:mannose-1-phosphate guanylyltransferase/mannose-6-phosphate isomerase [Escherichia coli]|uniref:mannose-1-phosphate guanylyltransferase/mannose-6-phosphate isomerase n=1 Tax=Escherichia coli TaxID=562 RepID=UPI00226E1D19|nr:mannose-1-phosphate guanylyltransferase/mannose-6-phosphate isomerase [Escherichia coli]MCX9317029.1 mannose-1-phosphate guanylyltransferase/mannose-6-phosphate isomerase [Escherichia coli]
MSSIIPVIMAGGSGSRLWPLSRELRPKQFLKLDGELTMLQATINRLKNFVTTQPLVICNEDHRFLVAEQLRYLGKLENNIILEPFGRNTAPAIALAAFTALQSSSLKEDPILLVLAADHVIRDEESFKRSVQQAVPYAKSGKLVTFGIVPTHAETGYGYIQRGKELNDAYSVKQFVEKPELETAQQYFNSGEYYWNSGMFLFRASRYLDELALFRSDIYTACGKAIGAIDPDHDFVRIDKDAFNSCPSDSIDYAVMEKTSDAVVVPMDAGWSDVGSWLSLWELSKKDSMGNSFHGDVIQHSSKNNFVFTESCLVSLVGVEKLVVVQTKDAILVADQNKVQDVKNIVEKLKNSCRTEHRIHREVFRPWGKHDLIDDGDVYRVKRISVKPGERLSLQMHHHRAEHWIVVSGIAKVTNGDNIYLLKENESTFIPSGTIHALENPGEIMLELIEVQSGICLDENDIIRL